MALSLWLRIGLNYYSWLVRRGWGEGHQFEVLVVITRRSVNAINPSAIS